MNYFQEKGIEVNPTEQNSQTPSRRPFSTTPIARGGIGAAVLVLSMLFFAVPTFAAKGEGPPKIGNITYPKIEVNRLDPTRAILIEEVAWGGAVTTATYEYSTSPSGGWQSALPSQVCEGEANNPGSGCFLKQEISGLDPETTYYVQLSAENKFGHVSGEAVQLTTKPIGPPEFLVTSRLPQHFNETEEFYCDGDAGNAGVGNHFCLVHPVGPRAAHLEAKIDAAGADTEYSVEFSPAEAGGAEPAPGSPSWKPVPGAAGTITAAQGSAVVHIDPEGLKPETTYFVRATATNHCNAAHPAEDCTTSSGTGSRFFTHTAHVEVGLGEEGIGAITATSAHIRGYVFPNEAETHWRFEYAPAEGNGQAPPASSPLWVAVPGGTGVISAAPFSVGPTEVAGDLPSLEPDKTYYIRVFAASEPEPGVPSTATSSPPVGFETAGSPRAETLALHALHGESIRFLAWVEPHGLDTHYRFQYVADAQFAKPGAEGGFAKAESTPELDAGAGARTVVEPQQVVYGYPATTLGVDVPGALAGVTYHYRIVASNAEGTATGVEQTLTVPAAPRSAPEPSCPNAGLRTGLSAHLPDCRAYEQLTPVQKEGAFDPFSYAPFGFGGVAVAEDGDHLLLDYPFTRWGSAPHDGQSPYFFSRQEGGGWQMTGATVQPEAGFDVYEPELYNPDLTRFAFSALHASIGNSTPAAEENVALRSGTPGGPYAQAAALTENQLPGRHGGWVAASEDFSKLVLSLEDHALIGGHFTGTLSGSDLYEDSRGQLRQLNVSGPAPGSTIGACGAVMAQGLGEGGGSMSARHAVSADGRRVFFEAVSGSNCSESKHLYMRVDGGEPGAETVDLGAFTYLAANSAGSEVLLEARGGETAELLLYNTETELAASLLSVNHASEFRLQVSEDFNTIYFSSPEQLTPEAPPGIDTYRYDIAAHALHFAFPGSPGGQISPDGRYVFFAGGVTGVPGGGLNADPNEAVERSPQVFRYDSAQNLIQCVSCASPFDPEPTLGAWATTDDFGSNETHLLQPRNGTPRLSLVSANGDFAFFETAAALLPSDQNGEIPPEKGGCSTCGDERPGGTPSNDIYEWRRAGLDGCSHPQGCLSLITPGTDGWLVALLGSTPSGNDVFFATRSQLLPSDTDGAEDIYDARINGGFPEAVHPVECEGDACSTPFAAPNDLTPSSATFQGAGNLLPGALPESKRRPKPKRVKAKKKPKKPRRRKRGGKAGTRHAKKAGDKRRAK